MEEFPHLAETPEEIAACFHLFTKEQFTSNALSQMQGTAGAQLQLIMIQIENGDYVCNPVGFKNISLSRKQFTFMAGNRDKVC